MENGITVSAFLPRGIRRGSLFFLSFGFALLLLSATSAHAVTALEYGLCPPSSIYVVNTTADSDDGTTGCTSGGTCSLRDAIEALNASTIKIAIIDLSGITGTVTLSGPLPAIDGSACFLGPAAESLTISGQDKYQIFYVPSTNAGPVDIFGLTLADGNNPNGNGGAIDSEGGLVLGLAVLDCTFVDNSASGNGGAIDSEGALYVADSTFDGNSANGSGGAIYGDTTSTFGLTVGDSTFADNSASSGSGAIDDNSASTGPETVQNNIFSGNIEGSGYAVDLANYNDGASEGYNLYYENYTTGTTTESDASVSYGTGDVFGTTADPKLLPLGNFGGPAETMMPEVGSAAICAGSSSDALNLAGDTDQRGFPIAPTVGACTNSSYVDIGAVQTNYVVVTFNGSETLGEAITTAKAQPYTDIGFSGFGTDPTNPGTIKLTSTLALTQGNTVIVGPPDAVAISGDSKVQILNVTGSSTFVDLYGLTLEDGSAVNGGAIFNDGATLAVANSTLSGNQATDSGGALSNDDGGTLTLANNTFYDNKALDGDGGAIVNSGTLAVTNSTFDSNHSGGNGGAINTYSSGTLTVADNIFANNRAAVGAGINNTGTMATGDEGHNLFYENYDNDTQNEDDAVGFTLDGTDVTGLDPMLAPLGNYGGPTQTMQPGLGGAAICAGTPTLPSPLTLPTTDQRGFPRTTLVGSKTCIDIGSVETEADGQAVTNYVNSLYLAGILNKGQDNSLVKELDKALEMASEGKYKGATNLYGFITEVKGLYANGVLTQAQADALLAYANTMLQSFPSQ